jgi:hypothetical protein
MDVSWALIKLAAQTGNLQFGEPTPSLYPFRPLAGGTFQLVPLLHPSSSTAAATATAQFSKILPSSPTPVWPGVPHRPPLPHGHHGPLRRGRRRPPPGSTESRPPQ